MRFFSDHSKDAVVSLSFNENSNFATFIAVQDELFKAYYELRAVYGYTVFEKSPDKLNAIET
ncbi:MAG: hypothetical protein ABI263_02555 [Gelidibacter sp.]